MELSLFTTWEGGDGKRRRELQPYLRIGCFEVCIDRYGIVVHLSRLSLGWMRGSGFWSRSSRVPK